MSDDPRGRRIAVVADARLEALLPELGASGFGAIQLPPADLEHDVARAWVDQVAEHVAEFMRHDYEVMLAGDGTWDDELAAALDAVGVPPLPQYAIQPPSTSRLIPET